MLLLFISRLVCGDVRGEFDELFKRVNAVNKRNGPFEVYQNYC